MHNYKCKKPKQQTRKKKWEKIKINGDGVVDEMRAIVYEMCCIGNILCGRVYMIVAAYAAANEYQIHKQHSTLCQCRVEKER